MGLTVAIVFCAVLATVYGSISRDDFYSFGISAGDASLPPGDDNAVVVPLDDGKEFPLFETSHNQVVVNNNGGLSFLRAIGGFSSSCSPISTPTVLPYWSDVNTLNGGVVFYRQTTDSGLLQRAQNDIQQAFPDLNYDNVDLLFIATWDNVAFHGALNPDPPCTGRNARNTFQIVLATDGEMSFAIFHYNRLDWTSGRSNGGNCSGLAGFPAKAGFDLGDGVKVFTLPGACTDNVLNLASSSNVNQNGKWIFRLDESFEEL